MGKSSGSDRAAQAAAEAQSKNAQQLIDETSPLRRGLIGDASDFLSGNRDVTGLPEFAALKGANEDQFNVARDNIIANTSAGGGLTAALAELEGNRAANQVDFTGALAGDEVNRALQLASFGTAAGTQGLASAGDLQGIRAGIESQDNAATKGLANAELQRMNDTANEIGGAMLGSK